MPLWSGRTGRLIAELAGLEVYQAASFFRAVNLLPLVPRDPRPKQLALRRAAAELREVFRGRRLITLGRQVSLAVGAVGPLLRWTDHVAFEALPLPHPSGRSRAYQDPETRITISTLLKEDVREMTVEYLASIRRALTA